MIPPEDLNDLADIIDRAFVPMQEGSVVRALIPVFREEAARREAEAKPCRWCEKMAGCTGACGEREGPDSAAAPKGWCPETDTLCGAKACIDAGACAGTGGCMKADKPAPADAEKARADRLAAALGLVLPLAKGYVAVNGGGGNREYINIAESALASDGGDRG